MNEQEPVTQTEKRDIFDKIMLLPVLRFFYPFYHKHKSVLLYLFFGVVTTAVDFAVSWLLADVLLVNPLIANPIAWGTAVLSAYVTNRIWVFNDKAFGVRGVTLEILRFAGSRVATLGFQEGAVLVFVTWLSMSFMLIKVITSVAVIILNYVFSKFFVFVRKNQDR